MSLNKIYKFRLDLKNSVNIPYMEFFQTDINTSQMNISIVNDSKIVDLTNHTVVCNISKSDKTKVQNLVNIIDALNGLIQINLVTQSLASVGENTIQLTIYEGNNRKSIHEFKYIVKSTLLDENAPISSNEFGVLTQLIDQVQNVENTLNINEYDRKLAETNRKQYFNDLKVEYEDLKTDLHSVKTELINTNLEINIEEDKRAFNETNRNSRFTEIESYYTQDKTALINLKSDLININDLIKDEELSRVVSEDTRQNNENFRQQEEIKRQDNEVDRQSVYSDIVENLTDKINEINILNNSVSNAELIRVDQEQIRKVADSNRQTILNNKIVEIDDKLSNTDNIITGLEITVDNFGNELTQISESYRHQNNEIIDARDGELSLKINLSKKFESINTQLLEIISKITQLESNGIPNNPPTNTIKTVDMFVMSGQSNMQGQSESLIPYELPLGTAYEYKLLSNSFTTVKHPFGESIGDLILSAHNGYGSLSPKFAESYYNTTGVIPLMVGAAKGDTKLEQWLKSGSRPDRYAKVVEKVNASSAAISQINGSIRGKYFVWLQGESDGINNVSKDTYKQQFLQLWNDLKTDCGFTKCFIIRVAKFYNYNVIPIMQAQEELAKENSDIIMTTRITGTFTTANGYLQSNWHYTNSGYNLVGSTVGQKIGNYIKTGIEPILEDEPYSELIPIVTPSISSSYNNTSVDEGTNISIPYTITDLQGGFLTATYTINGTSTTVNGLSTGLNNWVLGSLSPGTYTLSVKVSDSDGNISNTLTWIINVMVVIPPTIYEWNYRTGSKDEVSGQLTTTPIGSPVLSSSNVLINQVSGYSLSSDIVLDGNFTISSTVIFNSTISLGGMLFSYNGESNNADYLFYYYSGGVINACVGGVVSSFAVPSSFKHLTYNHFVLQRQGTTLRLYINNSLVASLSNNGGSMKINNLFYGKANLSLQGKAKHMKIIKNGIVTPQNCDPIFYSNNEQGTV